MEMRPHERLLQMLSAMLIQLNALQTMVDNEPTEANQRALREGMALLEQMMREVIFAARSYGNDLPAAELEGVTLADALSRLTEETAETLGLSSRVSFSGVDDQGKPKEHELSRPAEHLLYLVAREALYQVQRHTGARKLRLALNYSQDDVQMSIEDDGTYMSSERIVPAEPSDEDAVSPLAALSSSTEIVNITQSTTSIFNDLRYRIERLAGSLDISSQGERGTRVLARLPYAPHAHDSVPSMHIAPQVVAPAEVLANTESASASLIRMLVVDGQAVTRAGLRRLLESYADLQVIGEASDGVQAVSETLELGPQLVLLDAQLPNGQSIEALRQIKHLNLETRVLILSAQDREEYLYETLRAGADGYVLKDIAPDELAEAVRTVARGEVLVQQRLAGRLLSRFGKQSRNNAPPYESLTTRELEVLRLLARGLRNKEIAARLFVSERTVNFHLANIYQKLSVSGRTEALSKALEQGLISA